MATNVNELKPRTTRGQHNLATLAAGLLLLVCALSTPVSAAVFPPESSWLALSQGGAPLWDPLSDAANSTDVVGDSSSASAFYFIDDTDLFARLRLDTNPQQITGNLQPLGWGILIDTDGNLQNYDFSVIAHGVNDEIVLAKNTAPTNAGDPTDLAETVIVTRPLEFGATGNIQVTAASTSFNGTPDFFLDFAISLADLAVAGMSSGPITIWAGTSNNAFSLSLDLVGLASGTPGPGDLPGTGSDPITLVIPTTAPEPRSGPRKLDSPLSGAAA